MSNLLLDVLAKECVVEDAARAIHEENIRPFENFFTYFCQAHGLPNNTISSYNSDMIAVLQDVYSNISLEDPSDEREYTRRKQEQQRYVLSMIPMLRLALARSEHVLESREMTVKEVVQPQSGSTCGISTTPDKEMVVETFPSPEKSRTSNASPTNTKLVSVAAQRTPVSTRTPITNSDFAPTNVVPPSPPLSAKSNRYPKSAPNVPSSSKPLPPPQPSHQRTPIKLTEKCTAVNPNSKVVSPTKSNRTATQTNCTPTSIARNKVSSPATAASSRLSIATKTSPQMPVNPSTARSPSSVVSPDITSTSPTTLLSPSQERAFRRLSSGSNSSSNSVNTNNSHTKKLSPAMEQVKRQQAAKDYYNQLSRSRKPEVGTSTKA